MDGGRTLLDPELVPYFFFLKFFSREILRLRDAFVQGIASYHHHYTLALIYFIVINNYSSFSLLTYQTPSPLWLLSVSASQPGDHALAVGRSTPPYHGNARGGP